MQALRPQRQKAASKLIFTNGDFDDCQLFDSIDLTCKGTCKLLISRI
ncbi:hypothetical protein ES332_D08G095800v1 [Gossypium tomentosum]|nr:hypothetical protein ES332_D08G095800v1 [Gossypium tomentosum]